MEEKEGNVADGTGLEIVEKEENEANIVGSEEMELNMTSILEKIEHFTQMVYFAEFFLHHSNFY